MFVSCSETSINVVVKHVQHVGQCLVGPKKLVGCDLLGGSVPRLTLMITVRIRFCSLSDISRM